jgi:hypothetical protein
LAQVPYFPVVADVNLSGTLTVVCNFGQRPFSYTPPTGFVALKTFNLPNSTIVAGNKQMDATLYTGTGAALSVTNAGSFQPDLVWVKGRSGATDHALYDSVRGVQNQLESNNTTAETAEATGLTAFGSNGFTVGALAQMNTSAATYVGWQWKANGTAVTNTAGTVSAQLSANPTAGFSVATFTAPASGQFTIGHGLGVAPAFVTVKNLVASNSWWTYHSALGLNNVDYVVLDRTDAEASFSTMWGSSGMTSSTCGFTVGGAVNASVSHVAYIWTPIAGYSAFGSYTGNGSTDGPFVYTGFRPRFIMVKRTDSTGTWEMYDTSRDTYNVMSADLAANLADAEVSIARFDSVSNGFKLRNTGAAVNASGGTYIYIAFAENPFKNALAR